MFARLFVRSLFSNEDDVHVRATSASSSAAIWVLSALGACGPSVPAPQRLTMVLRPDLLEEARTWPQSDWSVEWSNEGQLHLERHAVVRGQLYGHDEIWITFHPPALPELSLRSWGSEGQASWYFTNIQGQCWISSDGTSLGTRSGPDLAIRCEGVGDYAGSPVRCGASLYLTSEQLVRESSADLRRSTCIRTKPGRGSGPIGSRFERERCGRARPHQSPVRVLVLGRPLAFRYLYRAVVLPSMIAPVLLSLPLASSSRMASQ
jgi:hypothetical protein